MTPAKKSIAMATIIIIISKATWATKTKTTALPTQLAAPSLPLSLPPTVPTILPPKTTTTP